MAWEDRDYYRERGSPSEYLGNPAALLGFSLPFGRWFGVPVRLHFWLLLDLVLLLVGMFRGMSPLVVGLMAAVLIGSLLVHDFAHRYAAQRVGGSLNEFLLWPVGGLIHPTAPPRPLATFIAHGGAIAAHLLVCFACLLIAFAMHFGNSLLASSLGGLLRALTGEGIPPPPGFATLLVALIYFQNLGLIAINLLPFYWFDGGFLLESILWPWTGHFRAISVTCIIGMCVAAPMFLFSLYTTSLFAMIFWALLFASSFSKRRELKAAGPAEFSAQMDFTTAAYASDPAPRRRRARWASRSAVKAAAAERREQETIDRILAKVHASGMHSLTWGEKRALKKATERQRRR
jgi:Zn-dependent protease